MIINRRNFIVGAAIAPTVAFVNPAFASETRKPFVEKGNIVDFLYFEEWERPLQPRSIGVVVAHVGKWNGSSYNIVLKDSSHVSSDYWDGIDAEWCTFHKEVPDFRWDKVEPNKYRNIHSYVREKRFGENPQLMSERMDLNSKLKAVRCRGTVPTRNTIFEVLV